MSTPHLYLRLAVAADVETLLQWRKAAAAWLAERHGSDQWSTEYPVQILYERVERGETFMASLEPGAEPIATISSASEPDPGLWTSDELQVPAAYLAKASVVREHAGRGIGQVLIDWADDRAARDGLKLIRIDVWTTNWALRAYYEQMGFEYVRTVPNVNSGALYVKSAQLHPGLPVHIAGCEEA